jgi:hypothetical protein
MALSCGRFDCSASFMRKVNFPHVESMVCQVRGYARRFYQGSTDHRGVPGLPYSSHHNASGRPGRVVTLLPEEGAITVGIAYKVRGQGTTPMGCVADAKDVQAVMKYLDYRVIPLSRAFTHRSGVGTRSFRSASFLWMPRGKRPVAAAARLQSRLMRSCTSAHQQMITGLARPQSMR